MSSRATDPRVEEASLLAAAAVGDVIEHWGFRNALGRVWTVLYLTPEPLTAAELGEQLQMSTGSISMTLTELQRWGVIQRVWRPGDRKEYFEAETDFWKMISRVVRERERMLVTSVRERLERASRLIGDAPKTAENKRILERVRKLLSFTMIAVTMIDSFVSSQTADFSEFGSLLKFAQPRGRKS